MRAAGCLFKPLDQPKSLYPADQQTMSLPISVPLVPMEAHTTDEMPHGRHWQYEPKWDGFRCIVFRDGNGVALRSKAGKSLNRYFPEVVATIRGLQPTRLVLDGELVIPVENTLSFEDLLHRIHPSASRVEKLSKERPAHLIAFDLLVDEHGHSLLETPLAQRRARLEAFARDYLSGIEGLRVSPATQDLETARGWFQTAGNGLDGIIAKRLDLPYTSGGRDGMVKIKHLRSADCVVGGFRFASDSRLVGSLLLGLYNRQGLLHHVGFTSGIKSAEREALTRKLEPLIQPPGFTGKSPGGPGRWATERSSEWQPLAPELVVEVQYDHFSGGRFRHGTRLLRWRPDKDPAQCTIEQVSRESRSALVLI